ncbi:unnamed protein product [Didymodactylos carnosus]|uniref:Uncharacterized protein n=1 Tax=Didymodactylos carnosus TaxID=1234261 RepID=A0A815J382_9BILA|nr:unnamed protein product [Didymodactylos carnosus]CAF1372712.1 unnamed protein product [Didymodactylos carnosus]CAF3711585.1 unnamed protein product [Didymodactylos carnosus]CAF4260502.1 unnamed protein product [Didymodactylos carnosus]
MRAQPFSQKVDKITRQYRKATLILNIIKSKFKMFMTKIDNNAEEDEKEIILKNDLSGTSSSSDCLHVSIVIPNTKEFSRSYTFNNNNKFYNDFNVNEIDQHLLPWVPSRTLTKAHQQFQTNVILRNKLEKLSFSVGKGIFAYSEPTGCYDFTAYRITPLLDKLSSRPYYICATSYHPYVKAITSGTIVRQCLSCPSISIILDKNSIQFDVWGLEEKHVLNELFSKPDYVPNTQHPATKENLKVEPWSHINDFLFIKVYDNTEQLYLTPSNDNMNPSETLALIGYASGVENVYKYHHQKRNVKTEIEKMQLKLDVQESFGGWERKFVSVGEILDIDDVIQWRIRPHNASSEVGGSGASIISLNQLDQLSEGE